MLNAIQANTSEPLIRVRASSLPNGNGTPNLLLEIEDSGPGFTAEALQQATAPFFTTKVVGLGLGLTIARRIVENCGGRLELAPPTENRGGLVRIYLQSSSSST
jgi:C4-dicarboxylate-specific signal transduction histidine kinase